MLPYQQAVGLAEGRVWEGFSLVAEGFCVPQRATWARSQSRSFVLTPHARVVGVKEGHRNAGACWESLGTAKHVAGGPMGPWLTMSTAYNLRNRPDQPPDGTSRR